MTNFETIQTIANITTSLTFVIVGWQMWLSNKERKKSNIQKRSEYIIDLYNAFINNQDMLEIYYQIEYSNFVYDINFHGSENERKLDKLLGHFSNIGRLFNLNILTKEDLKFIQYEYLVIYQNTDVQEYLLFLDNWCEIRQIKDVKFQYLRLTGEELQIDTL